MAEHITNSLVGIGCQISKVQADIDKEQQLISELEKKMEVVQREIQQLAVDETRLECDKKRFTIEMDSLTNAMQNEKRSFELLSRCKHSLRTDLTRSEVKLADFNDKIKLVGGKLLGKQCRFEDFLSQSERGKELQVAYKRVTNLKAQHDELALAVIFQEDLKTFVKQIGYENLPKFPADINNRSLCVMIASEYGQVVSAKRAHVLKSVAQNEMKVDRSAMVAIPSMPAACLDVSTIVINNGDEECNTNSNHQTTVSVSGGGKMMDQTAIMSRAASPTASPSLSTVALAPSASIENVVEKTPPSAMEKFPSSKSSTTPLKPTFGLRNPGPFSMIRTLSSAKTSAPSTPSTPIPTLPAFNVQRPPDAAKGIDHSNGKKIPGSSSFSRGISEEESYASLGSDTSKGGESGKIAKLSSDGVFKKPLSVKKPEFQPISSSTPPHSAENESIREFEMSYVCGPTEPKKHVDAAPFSIAIACQLERTAACTATNEQLNEIAHNNDVPSRSLSSEADEHHTMEVSEEAGAPTISRLSDAENFPSPISSSVAKQPFEFSFAQPSQISGPFANWQIGGNGIANSKEDSDGDATAQSSVFIFDFSSREQPKNPEPTTSIPSLYDSLMGTNINKEANSSGTNTGGGIAFSLLSPNFFAEHGGK